MIREQMERWMMKRKVERRTLLYEEYSKERRKEVMARKCWEKMKERYNKEK